MSSTKVSDSYKFRRSFRANATGKEKTHKRQYLTKRDLTLLMSLVKVYRKSFLCVMGVLFHVNTLQTKHGSRSACK